MIYGSVLLGVGGIAIGVFASWLFYRMAQRRAELRYSIIWDLLASQEKLSRLKGARLMAGRQNVDQIVWTDIVLANVGYSEITGDDIAKADPLRITGEIGRVLTEPQIVASRKAIHARLTSQGNDKLVEFDVLAPGDTIIVRVFSDKVPPWWSVVEGELKNDRFYMMHPYEVEKGRRMFDENTLIFFFLGALLIAALAITSVWGMSIEAIFASWNGVTRFIEAPFTGVALSLFSLVLVLMILDWIKYRLRLNPRAFEQMRIFVRSNRSEREK